MRDNIQVYHPYDKCSEHEKSRFYKENYVVVKKYKHYYLCEKLDNDGKVLFRECFSIFDIDGVPEVQRKREAFWKRKIRRFNKQMITYETRHDSHEKVNKEKRYMQIKSILGDKVMTAKEVAIELFKQGYTTSTDRNNAAPRLTELVDKCEVEVAGKKFDEQAGRSVATYKVIAKQLSLFAV